MPCLFGLLALFIPRVVIVALWFLTDWFEGIFETLLWPLLGLIFAPTTLLWYTVVVNIYGGHWGLVQIVGAVIAIAIDFSPAGSKR